MITNTTLVMSALYIFYAQKITELLGMQFKVLLLAIISSSAIIEAVSGALLTMAVVTIYSRATKNKAV